MELRNLSFLAIYDVQEETHVDIHAEIFKGEDEIYIVLGTARAINKNDSFAWHECFIQPYFEAQYPEDIEPLKALLLHTIHERIKR